MRTAVLALSLLCSLMFVALAQRPSHERLSLWPNGAPGSAPRKSEPEQAKDYWVKNVHDPSVEVYLPPPDKAADGIGIVDIASGKVIKMLHGGSDPEQIAISLDGTKVFASNEDAGGASVIDVATDKILVTVPVGEEPEGDAGVLDVVNRERADELDVLVQVQLAGDHVLGQLVGDHGGDRDRAQGEPVPRARGQRPRNDGDRRQAVGARSRPELLLPGGLRGQPRSCFRLSSMQRVAHGRASRRSVPIASPQLEQVPNVPSSIRARAASISFSTCVELSSSVDAISRSNVAVATSPRWLSW